jgi:putative tryptophan/tyrosine transport system substrate-binding protein
MKRRAFLAGTAALLATAQTPAAHSGEIKKIGWLSSGTLPVPGSNPVRTRSATEVAQFFDALKSYGWIEGQNVIVERRYADGRLERLLELASALVAHQVDAIHATSGTAGLAAKNATSTIPIVVIAGDIVGQGLVASLARPAGNVTGQTVLAIDLAGKRLDLLRELLPQAATIAVLGCDTKNNPAWSSTETAARTLGLRLVPYQATTSGEIEAMLKQATSDRVDGLLVLDCSAYNAIDRTVLLRHRLPAIYYVETFAHAGGLMAYLDTFAVFRRSAWYIDRILRGTKPADLPVEQATKPRLVINGRTAKELGLVIPHSILVRADEVIQ